MALRRQAAMGRCRRGLVGVDEGRLDGVPLDDALPGVGIGGDGALLLGDMEGLDEGSAQMGEGSDGFGFDLTLGDGGEEASQCGTEVASRHVLSGKIAGDFLAYVLSSENLRFPAGMEGAEIRMAGAAWHAAAAAIDKRERTQGRAVLGANCGHRSLQIERFGI
jgi:hypothetical protein